MMIFSLVAMTGLEKCCMTSAYLGFVTQVSNPWPVGLLFHSGDNRSEFGAILNNLPIKINVFSHICILRIDLN